ncbi:MAG TPA: hypothetical protein VGP62_04830 [Bryobacteraceae bacterium]|nr:hypothetical protein [Bryobacteraceae bacterium]
MEVEISMQRQIAMSAGLLFSLWAGRVQAQTGATSDGATMQALLTEVHQLRIALEKATVVVPRMQLALQRMLAQEQKVARVSQQLQDVRKQIDAETRKQADLRQQLSSVEQMLGQDLEATRRKDLEGLLPRLKDAVADQAALQQLRAQESDAATLLQGEQAVLGDLNVQLNAFDRMLAAPDPGHQ